MSSLQQNDPRLISGIRKQFLIPPLVTYYAKNRPLDCPLSKGKATTVLDLLHNMTGGFFIEYGTMVDEFTSNTLLHMERKLGWTGLLVETDPKSLELIYQMQRHAWVAPVCLSNKTSPMLVPLHPETIEYRGYVVRIEEIYDPRLQCLPIYSLLLALDRTKVDYFSFNVNGTELEILRTIPFDLVDIRIFTMEYREENEKDLQQFMTENGYQLHVDFNEPTSRDLIFVKNSSLFN